MSEFAFRLPDLGEGTVAAEIVAWRVVPGDIVAEDQPIAEMSTEKAVVEVPSPVAGRVLRLGGEIGDQIAVGTPLLIIDVGDGPADTGIGEVPAEPAAQSRKPTDAAQLRAGDQAPAQRIMASPATRRRAREAGIDLSTLTGTGPRGRIVRADLEAAGARSAPAAPAVPGAAGPAKQGGTVEEIRVVGVRRLIAQRMAEAKRTIPHFSYVEEVDITQLESLRTHLNNRLAPGHPPLSYLPFIVAALTRVLVQFPQCNAHYDPERNIIRRFSAVHVGIATQTANGLKVPVVRDADARSLPDLAAEIRRVADAARRNTATREELTGSTITVTSLGKLGGIVSTPIVNLPELAIVGVNRAVDRPVVVDGAVVVRRMMNLSSSFDHRFLDGHDAAAMIQALKDRLEQPATIFMTQLA